MRRARGCKCYIFMPEGVESGKIVGSTIYGAQVITIRGNYDDVNRLCSEIADKYGWAFVNINLRPYYTEGAKTFGFEVAEQLGWRLPDHIVVPTAGGTILPKVAKAFKELKEVGLINGGEFKIHSRAGGRLRAGDPRAAQAHRPDNAGQARHDREVDRDRQSGRRLLRAASAVRESGGWGEMASDPEIIDAIKLLARTEGIFAEPAGGTTLAVALKLIAAGAHQARRDAWWYRSPATATRRSRRSPRAIEQPLVIEARLKDFDALFERLDERQTLTRGRGLSARVKRACNAHAAKHTVAINAGSASLR